MRRAFAFLAFFAACVLLGYQAGGSEHRLIITEPKDGAAVPERPYISGHITDPTAEVWVVVHPMEVSDYWVQPRITVRQNGAWKVSAYIGRPGSIDIGKRFEIMAIGKPNKPLKEGNVLDKWPEAQWKSEVVEVVRK